ncbi:MAG: thiosulfate oxidation carrier protein SoxY [Methyloligellaceae bacterium]
MTAKVELKKIDRRDFVLGTAAVAALAAIVSIPAGPAHAKRGLDEAVKSVLGDVKPAKGRVSLELPEIAENGNTVPFSFSVESPMTKADHVKEVHIFASGNPRPDVATFMFSPSSGKASANSRMRLGKTQDIVAIAKMSDGKFYMTRQTVKVTIGGCGG